jgi:CSLREA domain-containing protein
MAIRRTIPLVFTLAAVSVGSMAPLPVMGMPDGTIVVSIQTDTVDEGDGKCSLREAVIAANNNKASGIVKGECAAGTGVDTIIVPVGTHRIQIDGADEQRAATGDLDIRESVNLYGAGKASTVIESDIADRIFHVPVDFDGIEVRIEDVTLTEGIVGDGDDGGAALKSESGLVAVEDVVLRRNLVVGTESGAIGGAIAAKGELQVTNCLFENNYANRGGAIFVAGGTTATIEKSLFLKNSAQSGGAVTNYGETAIENSTFSQNTARKAGGGALYNRATMSIRYCTLVGNKSEAPLGLGQAGALDNAPTSTVDARVSVRSTIFARNAATNAGHNNCNTSGTWLASEFNLEDDDTCPFGTLNLRNTDPGLAPLADWGGPTRTYALLRNSAAIDAGGNSGCPEEDQRSVGRPIDGNGIGEATCDIGAFEADGQYTVLYLPRSVYE